MGWIYLLCSCAACGAPIHVNIEKCPSIRIGGTGPREPICINCFNRWNEIHRTSKGLEPVPLDPQAYEPLNEQDMWDGSDTENTSA
jgi:hypothetical protein